jgi:predicted phage baseplate assembly protein
MPLPAPNLDDRRFQDLVDEAKRRVQHRCPEWTDHNVSDPGVTLIELFAWMTDQLLYRLNRVPERNLLKFLDLIDVKLFPPSAARCDVTFWLSAPRTSAVRIPAETEVATERLDGEDPVVFATVEELSLVPCAVARVGSAPPEGEVADRTAALRGGGFTAFDREPKPGDALLVGLTDAVPSCAVALTFACESEGVGVDPLNPPLLWEAWDGADWLPCRLERDETGGLNRPGDVVLHVPRGHAPALIANQRAGWLRCRVVAPEEGQPGYTSSPRILGLEACTVGGTVEAVHAEKVTGEVVGVSEGVPADRFPLQRRPVVPGDERRVLDVGGDDGWEQWEEVSTFAASGADSRHFAIDPVAGEVVFGPAVREPDGTLRHYGAVPAKGSVLRLAEYRTGGGHRGNVARGTLTVLRSSIPYVATVENAEPARGGVDGETVEEAKVRGPLALRTGDRAVTAEDYERLSREAAPEVPRARCVPADGAGDPGAVRLLVVPAATAIGGRIRFEQLVPSEESVERIARHLDTRRVLGARVVVEPPVYRGVTIVARVRPRFGVQPARLQSAALEALYRHFSPLEGGEDGTGWPFGRPVVLGEVYSVLQALDGVELVDDARLFAADPTTGTRGKAVQRLELEPNALVFSYEHRVLVEDL